MAKVEVTATFRPGFLKRLEREIQGSIDQLGELIVMRIRDLARDSNRMLENSGRQRLPLISDGWLDYKQDAYEDGRVARPGFEVNNRLNSNLTFTGQLLEALTYRFDGRDLVVFMPQSSRTDSDLTNEQVLDFLIDRDEGYDIMNLSLKLRFEITERIRRIINEELVRINS